MTQWYCNRDGVPVESEMVDIFYLEHVGLNKALVCPKCGKKWLTEQEVIGRLLKREQSLESKMA
jgi:hypothetical protein